MYDIKIGRLAEDPEAQGVIRPADDSWQLVIDKEGLPHLWLRAKLAGPNGQTDGLVPLDMFLIDGLSVADIVKSEFGPEVTDPVEIEACERDWQQTKERLGIPCPKG